MAMWEALKAIGITFGLVYAGAVLIGFFTGQL